MNGVKFNEHYWEGGKPQNIFKTTAVFRIDFPLYVRRFSGFPLFCKKTI